MYLWLASWETDSSSASQDFVCEHYTLEHKQLQAEQKPAFLLHAFTRTYVVYLRNVIVVGIFCFIYSLCVCVCVCMYVCVYVTC
jgi:hypothetical protein